jgi:hypothetical protein
MVSNTAIVISEIARSSAQLSAAQPYRLLLAGDWRATAAGPVAAGDLDASQRLRRQPG